MAWFKVDDGLHASRKLISIPKRGRFAAIGLWTIAGSWSADQLTDGHIPGYMITEFGAPPSAPQSLVDAGLWDREHDGYSFRNWHEYQPSKQDVDAERAAHRDRMRDLRAKRKQGKPRESGEASEVFTSTVPHSAESVRNPVPIPVPVPVPTPSGGSTDPAPQDPRNPGGSGDQNANAIVAEWIDNTNGPRPPGKVIGQLSKEIKSLLNEGHPYGEVRAATILWSQKALHPSTLASVLHESRNPRTMTRGSEERMNVGKSLFERAANLSSTSNEFPMKEVNQ